MKKEYGVPRASMAARTWWRAGYGVWAFGVGCLVLAVLAYVAFDEPLDASLAFGLGVLGLFALLVLTERVLPASAAEAAMQGPSNALHDAARGLALEGRASTVPAGANLQRDRLFLAAGESVKPLPVLDDSTVVYAAPATVRAGMAFDPPGRVLVDRWESESGQRFADVPLAALPSALAALGLSQGLFARFRLREERGRFTASFRPLDVRPPCLERPSDERPICERTGCALCSAACVALARNLQRPVVTIEAKAREDEIALTLEPEAS